MADRGLGILKTLKRVRPGLKDHEQALKVAFTEIISGREPEARGNGLKYVRSVISKNPINLLFQTGDAKLILNGNSADLDIKKVKENVRVKVIVKEVFGGEKHFWSIIPYWGIDKAGSKRILHSGNPDSD